MKIYKLNLKPRSNPELYYVTCMPQTVGVQT